MPLPSRRYLQDVRRVFVSALLYQTAGLLSDQTPTYVGLHLFWRRLKLRPTTVRRAHLNCTGAQTIFVLQKKKRERERERGLK